MPNKRKPGAPRGNSNAAGNKTPGNRSANRGRGRASAVSDGAILEAYAQAQGHNNEAARLLGMDRGYYSRRLKRIQTRA